MTQQEFLALGRRITDNQLPYKMVNRATIKYIGRADDLSETEHLGRNVFSVQGTNVLATDFVAEALDKYTGFSKDQQAFIAKATGEEGVRDFRNYLAAASSIANPTKVALVAHPESKTIVNVIPVEDELITSESFFGFAEIFMDHNNLTPTAYEVGGNASAGIILHMGSNTPDIRAFAPGEETLINSYILKWNLGQIQLSRYYERLVCANGMIEKISIPRAKITALDDKSLRGILSIPQDNNLLKRSYNRFSDMARTAMNTRASLSELHSVSKMLERFAVGEESSKKIAPYDEELNFYLNSGYGLHGFKPREALASMKVWELFNRVTQYASHTTDWAENDNRRTMLQGEAVDFLRLPRDIKTYVDVFAS
jgi:hypothetical protein